jgi:CheY-like chemotaxis protein
MTTTQAAGAAVLIVVLLIGGRVALVRCGLIRLGRRMRARMLTIVESLQITPAASLHVIRVGERAMLVGASTSGPLVLLELGGGLQSQPRSLPKPQRVRVLIVEPAAVMRMVVATIVRAHGLTIAGEGESVDEAIASCGSTAVDVVLVDVALLGASSAHDAIAAAFPHVPIVVSGYLSQRALVEAALASGAAAYVAKPFVPQRLTETLRKSAADPEDVREAAPNSGV